MMESRLGYAHDLAIRISSYSPLVFVFGDSLSQKLDGTNFATFYCPACQAFRGIRTTTIGKSCKTNL